MSAAPAAGERVPPPPPGTARALRWAQGAYVILAILLACGLPPVPSFALAYWLGTAAAALVSARQVGRGSRTAWRIAALLSLLVLVQSGVGLAWMVFDPPAGHGIAVAGAFALLGGAVLSQAVAAACCWRTRHYWLRSEIPAP